MIWRAHGPWRDSISPEALLACLPVESVIHARQADYYHILAACDQTGPLAALEFMKRLKVPHRPTFRTNFLRPAIAAGLVEPTLPDKPNSRLQKYRLTSRRQMEE